MDQQVPLAKAGETIERSGQRDDSPTMTRTGEVDTAQSAMHSRIKQRWHSIEEVQSSSRSYISCLTGTAKPTVRRKRQRSISKSISTLLLLTHYYANAAYTVTWNNGPEDSFFCGLKWDDANCATRQNCRTGKHEECQGFAQGEKCFAYTNCDTKSGGGFDFVEIIPEVDTTPSYMPSESLVPTRKPGSPTMIPTEYPIEPPPPLSHPSPNATDHWFCGIGIDDTNQKCGTHCPTASECSNGEICYFGTACDARTHSPTPPPTRRPTESPTPSPTVSPTVSFPPSISPTATMGPTVSPTEQGPTRSPTQSPTKKPTWSPLTAVQSGFFCGLDWNDAIGNCKKRCPSGEDPECPEGEYCFAFTGCQEEKGYPDDEKNKEEEEGGGKNNGGGGKEQGQEINEACVSFEVTIVPDNWPQETSWTLTNQAGEVIAEDNNDKLEPGVSKTWMPCIQKRECYEFKIMDSSGDGLCCTHGDGSYELKLDGEVVKNGAAFYDDERTEVGGCGETVAPTKAPSAVPEKTKPVKPVGNDGASSNISSGGIGDSAIASAATGTSPSGKAFRCVATDLIDSGYKVVADMCGKFDDCYNEWIEMGDDWFCGDGSKCIETPACGISGGSSGGADQQSSPPPPPSPPAVQDTAKPPTPNPTPQVTRPMRPIIVITPRPTRKPVTFSPTSKPTTASTEEPTGLPTETSTLAPSSLVTTLSPTTFAPTLGPCDGKQCPQLDQCRSQYGFCGAGEVYCNERSIWTEECGTPAPSPVKSEPLLVVAEKPTYQKPSGSGKPKPSGGKGPVNESPNTFPSVPTNAPTTLSTWVIYKQQDTTTSPPTPLPTPSPTSAPNADFIVLNSSDSVNFEIISNSPTPALQVVSSGSVSTTQDDESCSGDPCPVSSHCRGSYGSCGPGFIYCNAKTIWSSSCPAKPTKEPTHGPTKVPTVKAPAAVPVLEPVANTPTLPTLPKPTLPYITGSTPVKLPDFSSSVHSVTPGDKKFEASDEAKEDDVKEEEPEKDSETDDIFLNKDYLNEFTEWTMSRNTGSSAGSFFMGFQFTFLAAISFICFV